MRPADGSSSSKLVIAVFLLMTIAGCFHDFDTFNPIPGEDDAGSVNGDDAGLSLPDARETPDAPAGVDSSPGTNVDASGCGADCRVEATSCAGVCAEEEQSCAAACDGGACTSKCVGKESTCTSNCVTSCETCTSGEGCVDPTGCAAAAP